MREVSLSRKICLHSSKGNLTLSNMDANESLYVTSPVKTFLLSSRLFVSC
jgi:hypothetical protein